MSIEDELNALKSSGLSPAAQRVRAQEIAERPLRAFVRGDLGLHEVDTQSRAASAAVRAAGLGPKLVVDVLREEGR